MILFSCFPSENISYSRSLSQLCLSSFITPECCSGCFCFFLYIFSRLYRFPASFSLVLGCKYRPDARYVGAGIWAHLTVPAVESEQRWNTPWLRPYVGCPDREVGGCLGGVWEGSQDPHSLLAAARQMHFNKFTQFTLWASLSLFFEVQRQRRKKFTFGVVITFLKSSRMNKKTAEVRETEISDQKS